VFPTEDPFSRFQSWLAHSAGTPVAWERHGKLAYDPDRDAFVLRKILPEGMSFPFDFVFIPSTAGDDGDPLDVLVLIDAPVAPGTIVPSRLIGVIEATQTEKDGESVENDRLIAIAPAVQSPQEVIARRSG